MNEKDVLDIADRVFELEEKSVPRNEANEFVYKALKQNLDPIHLKMQSLDEEMKKLNLRIDMLVGQLSKIK